MTSSERTVSSAGGNPAFLPAASLLRKMSRKFLPAFGGPIERNIKLVRAAPGLVMGKLLQTVRWHKEMIPLLDFSCHKVRSNPMSTWKACPLDHHLAKDTYSKLLLQCVY
eukprot:1084024-Amphidinium_carterae.1